MKTMGFDIADKAALKFPEAVETQFYTPFSKVLQWFPRIFVVILFVGLVEVQPMYFGRDCPILLL